MDNLRVVTLNLWCNARNIERRLEVITEGMHPLEPDMVALQEVREAQLPLLARSLSLHPAFGLVDAGAVGGPIGNGILSRFPIERSESLLLPSDEADPRGAVKAVVKTPHGEAHFLSTHLSCDPDLAARREQQVVALNAFAAAPGAVHVVLAGDFNAAPAARAIRFLTGLDSLGGQGTFFRDAWARRHPHDDGNTWSSRNPGAVRWIEQDRRIDYVFVRGAAQYDGSRTIEDARVVLDSPAADGTWPSDHFGVLVVVRLASRMDARPAQ
jgi:endonuclease/exonuclease/phosphatase family metal-dependent hydrolase